MPRPASFVSLPEKLLDIEHTGQEVRPRYLTPRHRGWVEELLDRLQACRGLPRAEVEQRLASPPGRGERWPAWRAMVQLGTRLAGFGIRPGPPPSLLRQVLFQHAGAAPPEEGREQLMTQAAAELGIAAAELEQDLYADVPARQLLGALQEPLSPEALMERYNLALAQSLLLRSEWLTVRVGERAKAVLRFARLQRLLCVTSREPSGSVLLWLSGPLSLFHHTLKYGRAMAAWLPAVVHAPCWELKARVNLAAGPRIFRASFRDPISTHHVPPRRFDSRVEERFFRDLRRHFPSWTVLREAAPVQVGRRILCPDFVLRPPGQEHGVSVEIVGYWTPEYLQHKREVLATLPPAERWVLCVDETLAAREPDLARGHDMFFYRGKVDVPRFMEFLSGRSSGTEAPRRSRGQHIGEELGDEDFSDRRDF